MDSNPQSSECAYFNRGECRSCSLLGLKAGERAQHKHDVFEARAKEQLRAHFELDPIWQPRTIFPSRSKAKLSVSGTMKDPVIGLVDRALESTELLDCPLHLPRLNEILHFIKAAIPRNNLAPYHISRQQGELKGLILKSNESGTEVAVRFVLRSQEALAKVKRVARELQAACPFVKVVSANIQPVPAAVLEGELEILLTESHVIWEDFSSVRLAFKPQSFSQVTHQTAEALYRYVRQQLVESRSRSLLDLYCGVGGFSILSASTLEWACGVEQASQSIECALLSCSENDIQNLRFEAADVENYLSNYSGAVPDVVLFNPPRRGLSTAIIERTKAIGPQRLLYSSCNPETLLRDLGLFSPRYRVRRLSPFDMFPLTDHLEVVALLEREES